MMVNKAKKQGTNYETNIVNRLNKVNNFKAQRFAEGGSNDLGDIQLFIEDEEFFIEAKSRQNLNLHQTLDKAINEGIEVLEANSFKVDYLEARSKENLKASNDLEANILLCAATINKVRLIDNLEF